DDNPGVVEPGSPPSPPALPPPPVPELLGQLGQIGVVIAERVGHDGESSECTYPLVRPRALGPPEPLLPPLAASHRRRSPRRPASPSSPRSGRDRSPAPRESRRPAGR